MRCTDGELTFLHHTVIPEQGIAFKTELPFLSVIVWFENEMNKSPLYRQQIAQGYDSASPLRIW